MAAGGPITESTRVKKKQARKASRSIRKSNAPKPSAAIEMAGQERHSAPGEFLDDGIKHDPRKLASPGDVLVSKVDEAAPLEEQVKWSKERHKVITDYFGYLIGEEHYMKNAMDWQFAENWSYEDFADATLPQDQKKQLVASLDGYYVQNDLDDIVSRLNPVQQQELAKTLAATFLMKTVVDKFFKHPFWYVDAIPVGAEEQREDTPWQDVSPDGAVLKRFLTRFEEGGTRGENHIYARIWRNVTARLCNAMCNPRLASFGKTQKALRRAKCQALANQLLADETFQCLLKPTEGTAEKESALGYALTEMSDIIVPMLSQEPTITFRTLNELEPRFHHTCETMESDWDHALNMEGTEARLDGHRVLIIHHPFVVMTRDIMREAEETVICKAPAMMEDPEGPKETASV
ncbi:hypothetical protein BDV19DRAFT_389699 [Aspergillus venezuelensis]